MQEKHPAITIKIFGEDYRIRGVKDPEYINQLAAFLDKKMREAAANTQITSSNKLAVLAALNIADELHKSKEKHKAAGQEIRERIRNLIRLIETQE
ncbi:MAG: cell division protein ZapA [Candidatus Ratteibacteria bacterium]|nr:cell division protein ZapA [Candidatus Ratteibacteria bacterium]